MQQSKFVNETAEKSIQFQNSARLNLCENKTEKSIFTNIPTYNIIANKIIQLSQRIQFYNYIRYLIIFDNIITTWQKINKKIRCN